MKDPLEQAEAATELWLSESLRKKAVVPENTGECLECGEPTPGAFCSKECREDYERIARLRAISGKK